MGTKAAPTLANIFMAEIEENFLKYRADNNKCLPLTWLRYIDDILTIWNHSQTELDEELNNAHFSLTFTHTTSLQSVDFLDTTKGQRHSQTQILDIRPYHKDISTNTLLHYTSCHPRHTFTGIIKSQALRLLTASSDSSIFAGELKNLETKLLQKEYPLKIIKTTLRNITYSYRSTHLRRQKNINNTIPIYRWSLPYNPQYTTKSLKQILQPELYSLKLQITYHTNKSIQRLLNNNVSSPPAPPSATAGVAPPPSRNGCATTSSPSSDHHHQPPPTPTSRPSAATSTLHTEVTVTI